MTLKRKCAAAIALLSLFPAQAQALCLGMGLSGVPGTATFMGGAGEYGVFDTTEYMQTVNFQVGGGAAIASCDYFVVLSAGSSGSAAQRELARGGDTLDYNVYTTAAKTNILKDIASAGAGEVISGTFPLVLGLGQTNNHSLFWTIDPLQIVSADAARFQDVTLTLSLYTGLLLGVFVLADTATITFQAQAESSVDLSLVDTGGAFNIGDTAQTADFGTLSTGESLSYDTVIRSNDGYRVTLQSANSQEMKHLTLPDTVPYSLTFDGAAVDMTSGAAVQAVSSPGTVTAATGDSFPSTLTVGAMTGAETAGDYQDVITVTVAAQ